MQNSCAIGRPCLGSPDDMLPSQRVMVVTCFDGLATLGAESSASSLLPVGRKGFPCAGPLCTLPAVTVQIGLSRPLSREGVTKVPKSFQIWMPSDARELLIRSLSPRCARQDPF